MDAQALVGLLNEYFTDMVGRFCAVGIDEFVLYWPGTWRDEPRGETVMHAVTNAIMPALRAGT